MGVNGNLAKPENHFELKYYFTINKLLYFCDIFGVDHIWLQSDAAFVYPRLDSTALSVGMLWAT